MAPKKKMVRQARKRKTHAISPIHSAAEESGGDGEAMEEIQQVSVETEPVNTAGTSTALATPTASTSPATSGPASLPSAKKTRRIGIICEVQQVPIEETEPIPGMVTTAGPTAMTTTIPTASTSTATLSKKTRRSGFISEEDEENIEWLNENRFIYDMKSKQYKDKAGKTTAWQAQADHLGFEGKLKCILNSLRFLFSPIL